jgi:cob(I)alamin adenosyltransferase
MACENDSVRPSLPKLRAENIEALEAEMDRWENELPPLKNFILPGGSVAASHCHVARTVCRRTEREIVRLSDASITLDTDHLIYINRLSDWLFLLARRINFALKREDSQWDQT